jgi:hypothetical protein
MNHEEKLQNEAEAGKGGKDLEARAYRKVFDALSKEPEYTLPPSFADKVVMMVQAETTRKASGLEILLAVIGILFLLLTLGIAILVLQFKPDFGFLEGAEKFKGLFIFGMVFILLLQWLDKMLVRKKSAV